MDIVTSEHPRGHALLDVVIADLPRVDLVARASRRLVRCCIQTDDYLRDCARRAFSEHGISSPSASVLVTWFQQRLAVTFQCTQARAIHARTARLEASSSLLSTLPSRAVVSARDLMAIAR